MPASLHTTISSTDTHPAFLSFCPTPSSPLFLQSNVRVLTSGSGASRLRAARCGRRRKRTASSTSTTKISSAATRYPRPVWGLGVRCQLQLSREPTQAFQQLKSRT
eukprot:1278170-Rhodomonas_salina.2